MTPRDACRPDPDELLRRVQAEEIAEGRGRLKIFLGYAPRVGKSLRMFEEGTRRRARGQDVVIGAVQSVVTNDIARAIGDLESFRTLDVPAIIRRSPQVCLIDELARENPPGSRNPERWQDVNELRAAGINVVGALNLQHVCERQDAVEAITGRRAKSCVPLSFILSADEIVIVDVPAEDVAGGAGNLSAAQFNELREVALLLAAEVVEQGIQRYMDTHGILESWGTQERILVCITPRSGAGRMIESAAGAVRRFHAHLLAVAVRQAKLSPEDEASLRENLRLAAAAGAEVHEIQAADPVSAIVKFARENRVTQLYIGHTARKRWKIWSPSHAERLVAAADGMDVRIFPHGNDA
jgi:two-component system sensor histidine kinase KdpD